MANSKAKTVGKKIGDPLFIFIALGRVSLVICEAKRWKCLNQNKITIDKEGQGLC
jgi:hypothetical protein